MQFRGVHENGGFGPLGGPGRPPRGPSGPLETPIFVLSATSDDPCWGLNPKGIASNTNFQPATISTCVRVCKQCSTCIMATEHCLHHT